MASHMARGQQYFADGNLEKARVEFRNALQILPNDAEARFMNGRVNERLGNLREAAGMYQAAIDAKSDHVAARASLGRMFVFAGAPKRALEYVEPGLATHPDDPDLLTTRAAARAQLQEHDAAMSDALRAIELSPTNENAIALLASLHRQAGENGKAIELLKAALERAPRSVELRLVLANLYGLVGDDAATERELRRVVELQPDRLAHRYELALFLVRLDRLEEAERVLEAAVAALPRKAEAKVALAEFLARHRSVEAGTARLSKFIEAEPANLELRLGLATIQQRNQLLDSAAATLQAIVDRDRDSPDALTALNRIAAIRIQQSRVEEADRLIETVLQKNPRDNDALLLRGTLALERNDPTQAVADLRAVLRDQPGSAAILQALARAHVANGESALAEENLRAALEAAPEQTAIRVELGQLLTTTGRAPQAVSLLEEAVRRAPDDAAPRAALFQAYVQANDVSAARRTAEDLKILDPKSPAGFYFAGLVAQAERRLDDAERNFEAALERAPAVGDALAALVRLKVSRGATAAAEARVRAALARTPGNVAAVNLLGELALSRRDFDTAAGQFSQAIALSPGWWLPYRNLGVAEAGRGRAVQAIQAFESGLNATRQRIELLIDLGALQERLGEPEAAISTYERLLARYPESQVGRNNLAMLLASYRTDAASLERARMLTAGFENSDNASFLDTFGWVRVKSGQAPQALAALEKAVRLAPTAPQVRFHLASAQIASGQRAQARKNLEAALASSSDFAGSRQARTLLEELK